MLYYSNNGEQRRMPHLYGEKEDAAMIWVCLVCGDEIESDEVPEVCPVCGADSSQFEAKQD